MLRIFRHYYSTSAIVLALCETIVVALALYGAASYLVPSDEGNSGRYLAAALVPALVNAVLMYSLGLYDPQRVANFRRALPRLLICLAIGAPLLGRSLFFDVPDEGETLLLYAGWTALVIASIVFARIVVTPLTRAQFPARRVLVVGAGRLAAEVEQMLAEQAHPRTRIVGYVPLNNEALEVPQAWVKANDKPLLEIARENGAKEIVVALDDRRGAPLKPLLDARMEGITITSYPSFCERETRRISPTMLDSSWLIYADGFHVGSRSNQILKRGLDVVASLALLVLTLPTLLLAAIAIRIDSPGPILYRQDRVGLRGKIFPIYKFRTMRVDAETLTGPQWAAVGDPRVTRVGGFLRRMRIDELPQILNVLRGEMSFVGPRPERPFFVAELVTAEIPLYAERHRVRPGITGWAQINYPYGASIADARTKLAYDLYYIKNFSFLFDLMIILSTAKAVFLDKGGR